MERARAYALLHHGGQLDDCDQPYINHPIAVAVIVSGITKDEEVISSAYLHDVIEDTDVTYAMLLEEFGYRIADLVNEVTHEGQKDEKGFFFPRLHSTEAIMIKLADRLHNLSRMEPWAQKRQDQYLRKTVFWRTGVEQ